MNKELKYNICFYIYFLLMITMLAFLSNNIDPDFWARILQGDAFWQLGQIFKTDIFSYIPTHIWLDHEWGASVLFSFILNHFGYWGIFGSRIIIVFLIFYFVFKTAKLGINKDVKPIDVFLFSFSIISLPTLLGSALRCHFLTFLFFTIFLYLLERVRKKGENKLLFILPPLMLIWANTHGGCVAGLGVLAIYSLGEALNKKPFKKYIFTLFACFLVMFINPYGIDYVKFIFMATTMPRPNITEWISPFLSQSILFTWFKIFYVLFFVTLILKIKDYKNDFTKYILLFVCAYLSFKYIKNTPFFILVSIMFLYKDICIWVNSFIIDKQKEEFWKTNILPYILMTLYFVGASIIFFASKPDIYYLCEQPVQEIEFLKINNLKGRVLAPLDLGSYIAYKLFPNNLIYMDGRYEEVYFNKEKELLDKFYNAQDGWEKVLNEPYKPDYIIIPVDAVINDYIPDNYKAVYKTQGYILYSVNDKLKDKYILPSADKNYYTKNAFKKGFELKKADKKTL